MKLLLVGYGSIGQRHYSILKRNFNHEIFIFRHQKNPNISPKNGENFIFSWEDVEKIKPDVALICNLTELHIHTSINCAIEGMHLFIEKPLDASFYSPSFSTLANLVREKQLITYVAYPLRFSTDIQWVKQNYFEEELHNSFFVCCSNARNWYLDGHIRGKEQGGGATLELSHEIDLAQYLGGPIETIIPVNLRSWNGVDSQATYRIIYENGNTSGVHLNILGNNEWRFLRIGKHSIHYDIDDECYRKQFEYFFDNIGNPEIMNNVFEAGQLLDKILKARDGSCQIYS